MISFDWVAISNRVSKSHPIFNIITVMTSHVMTSHVAQTHVYLYPFTFTRHPSPATRHLVHRHLHPPPVTRQSEPEENRWEPPTPDPIAVVFYQSLAPPATRCHP